MKNLVTSILILLASGMAYAQIPNDGQEFTVRGEIAGLNVGDTLRFERIELPRWDYEPAFDVVVETSGSFEYTGRQPHTQYYLMRYLPLSGKVNQSSRAGLTMIIDGGTVSVEGNVDEIYFSRVDGEAFGEQPLLREAEEIENSMGKERSHLLRLADEARIAGDSLKSEEYLQQFNEFLRDEESKRVDELRRQFLNSNPSSTWSLVYRMERADNTPVETLEAYYARLDETARESYYGKLLKKTIDHQVSLLPGNTAPAFSVTFPDGTVMDSEKFHGKYLLIYHWGFCPGSIQREMELTDLYNRFRDHLQVLGITQDLEAIRQAALTAQSDDELFGIKLKPVYESMTVHPWIDVEEGTGENLKIGELYSFGGFPYFILISPDGKIVSRGFHDSFFETKRILEEQYGY